MHSVRRYVFGEVVSVKIDEGAKKLPQLGCVQCPGRIRKDALEGGDASFAFRLAAGLLAFVLLLLLLEFRRPALLLFALLLG